jgi:hypothetical protein
MRKPASLLAFAVVLRRLFDIATDNSDTVIATDDYIHDIATDNDYNFFSTTTTATFIPGNYGYDTAVDTDNDYNTTKALVMGFYAEGQRGGYSCY